jgi:hypothetical protein
LGTARSRGKKTTEGIDHELIQLAKTAIETGYRHLDCAEGKTDLDPERHTLPFTRLDAEAAASTA